MESVAIGLDRTGRQEDQDSRHGMGLAFPQARDRQTVIFRVGVLRGDVVLLLTHDADHAYLFSVRHRRRWMGYAQMHA